MTEAASQAPPPEAEFVSEQDVEADSIQSTNSTHNPQTDGFDYATIHAVNPNFVPREAHVLPHIATGLGTNEIQITRTDNTHWVEGGHDVRCTKKRNLVTGHKARCGMWIWTCLQCEHVVGWHIMRHGEGRRDAILSLYKYMEEPPDLVICDFGCMLHESSMNWVPHFANSIQFGIDTLHKFGHTCSEHFGVRHLTGLHTSNTSLAEQVNAFLQPIRGLLSSATTLVGIFIYMTAPH